MTGSGTPMRAGIVLEALAAHYRISLLVAPSQGYTGLSLELPKTLGSLCENVAIMTPREDHILAQRAGEVYPTHTFDVVHVFRLAAIPMAQAYLKPQRSSRNHLDLDDVESKTHGRIARLCRENGNPANADVEEARASRLGRLEAVAFRIFHRIYVCSELDRQELLDRYCRAEVAILKNVVRLPGHSRAVGSAQLNSPFRFLFVGTLGYYPNEDAVRYFCTEILPRIREQATTPFIVDIVGRGGTDSLRQEAHQNLNFVGEVPDVVPHFQKSNAVIVPLRAGGGTRIKILEAFSHGRPVIATSIGIEGIDAVSEEHVLVGDTDEAFACQCLRLMSDAALGKRLAANANDLLRRSYTLEALKASIAQMLP